MGIFEPQRAAGLWNERLKVDTGQGMSASTVVGVDGKFDSRIEDVQQETRTPSNSFDHQEARKPADKTLRRLAQNREAARKSRLRKKAYIQQLESSRLKLAQLEQELNHARHQGVYTSGSLGESALGLTGSLNSGVTTFEIAYTHWIEVQNRQTGELRAALQEEHVSDMHLEILVEAGVFHYEKLFHMKRIAAKSDVFYIMSGMWKTPVERFFLWIGGFRPSELLKILAPQIEPLLEQQVTAVYNLQQSSRQAEDALLQGMEKLKQTLAESLTDTQASESPDPTNYMVQQMANALDKLEALVGFINQADHLRQETLLQLNKILTSRQAARGLLALGEYCQRLRMLSSLWEARLREPA